MVLITHFGLNAHRITITTKYTNQIKILLERKEIFCKSINNIQIFRWYLIRVLKSGCSYPEDAFNMRTNWSQCMPSCQH